MLQAVLDDQLVARLTTICPLPGVRAGSGLAWHGKELVVVQDDAFAVVKVNLDTMATISIPLNGKGEPLEKPEKPDFESVVTDLIGDLYLLGSGSTPMRRQIARLDLDTGKVTLETADELYKALEAAVGGTPNLEGAVLLGEVLRVFQRGEGRGVGLNLAMDVPFMTGSGPAPRVLSTHPYDLGAVDGVALTFTDAAPFDGERFLYLAVAEDTPNAYDDGPVVGAAIGVMGLDTARWTRLLEADGSPSTRKIEGIALEPGGRAGYVITDPDDPKAPAELCRLVLEGPWQV